MFDISVISLLFPPWEFALSISTLANDAYQVPLLEIKTFIIQYRDIQCKQAVNICCYQILYVTMCYQNLKQFLTHHYNLNKSKHSFVTDLPIFKSDIH